MKLPTIKNANFKGKCVLLRVDFNVLDEKNKIDDFLRIERVVPTIKFLKNKGAKVIILSYLSEGKGVSLKPVADFVNKNYFTVGFSNFIIGGKARKRIADMSDRDVLILENIHRDRKNKEKDFKNDKKFSAELAALGDIFVNDAFAQSHRKYSSIIGIPKYLPSYAGLLFEKEVENLSKAFKPKHPFLLILGGVKFESKLSVLEKFIRIADKIFIGGALANNFFKSQKLDIGKSLFDKTVSVKKYLKNRKIILPIDVRKKNGVILDIGPKSVRELSNLVKKAKFILWNGPMGNFEEKKFAAATFAVARLVAKSRAISIVGGGDTIAAATKAGVIRNFSFVSTGGGAMLEFLAKGTLPGIEAIRKSKKKK
jgi:phosphoglycerate kinase